MPALPLLELPSYEMELVANQRVGLRTACLLAAPIVVAFSLLDRATAPEQFLPLLLIRCACACGLLVIARLARMQRLHVFSLMLLALSLLTWTIEIAILATGGPRSPYLTSMIAVLAGTAILAPLRTGEALLLQLLALCIAVLPLAVRLRAPDALALATQSSYLLRSFSGIYLRAG